MEVSDETTNPVQIAPPIVTPVVPVKPEPVIVIEVPPDEDPEVGATEVGAGIEGAMPLYSYAPMLGVDAERT